MANHFLVMQVVATWMAGLNLCVQLLGIALTARLAVMLARASAMHTLLADVIVSMDGPSTTVLAIRFAVMRIQITAELVAQSRILAGLNLGVQLGLVLIL